MEDRHISILGENIRRYRLLRDSTQFALSVASGVHQSAISAMESGSQKDMKTQKVLALAKALDVTVEDLLTEHAWT